MKSKLLTKDTLLDYGVSQRDFPKFNIGDSIEVGLFVKDKNKERVQKFEGDVIAMRGRGVGSTFTVRKIGNAGVGIEMILPFHSPKISDIKLVREGRIRRAKLFYLRGLSQKAAKIKPKKIIKK